MDEFNLFECLRSFSKYSLYKTLDPIKTVLGIEIFRIANLASNSVGIMRAGRIIGLLAALTTLGLMFLMARALWPQTKYKLLVLVGGLSFSNFFERAFRIRTDTIALMFAVGSALLIVQSRRERKFLFLSGILLGLSFLCTQKTVYFLIAYGLAFLVATWSRDRWQQILRDSLCFISGWLAPIVAYAIYFGGTGWWHVVYMIFMGPRLVLAGSAAFTGLGMFIQQTLIRNIIPYALAAAGLIFTLIKWKKTDFPVRFLLISTIIITILIFHHDQPWPYVFVWPQAFLAFWFIPLAEEIADRGWLTQDKAVLAMAVLAALSLPRQIRYLNLTNHRQIAVMTEAERLLEPQSTYFDGTGMIVDRDIAGKYPWWWWDIPTMARIRQALHAGDATPLLGIVNDHPKLWIINYRIFNMSDLVRRMVAGGYVRISPNILLTGTEVKPGAATTRFACYWGGPYQVFDAHGRPVLASVSVDNTAPATVVHIPPGLHEIKIQPANKARFLLPEGTLTPGPLAPKGPVPALFADVYTY